MSSLELVWSMRGGVFNVHVRRRRFELCYVLMYLFVQGDTNVVPRWSRPPSLSFPCKGTIIF